MGTNQEEKDVQHSRGRKKKKDKDYEEAIHRRKNPNDQQTYKSTSLVIREIVK